MMCRRKLSVKERKKDKIIDGEEEEVGERRGKTEMDNEMEEKMLV